MLDSLLIDNHGPSLWKAYLLILKRDRLKAKLAKVEAELARYTFV